MRKKITAFLLSAFIMLSLALPANAKTNEKETTPQPMQYTISNYDAFMTFAEKCRVDSFSENLKVSLLVDIDLADFPFEGIPIFCGTFEGNGHSIRGLNLSHEGSAQGLFRYLTDTAVVQNLHVEGKIEPGGSRSKIGGIAGSNAGKILNCSFSGTVAGNEFVGGITGSNEVTGVVEHCQVFGSVYGNHFVGGLAGKNSGVIRNGENAAQINDTAIENHVELSDITMESLTSSEAVNTVTDIGGIAGTSSGVIRSCVNRGNVGYQHMGYNIGGIAGTQSGSIADCENHGLIQGRKEIGGIVGQMEPTALVEYEEDALQILQKQLSSMGSTVSATVSNMQGSGNTILYQVGILQEHVWNARDAVDTLIHDRDNPELPDLDTIQAARNTISSSMSGMTQTLDGMGSTAYNAMGAMSTNLYTLQNQINAMRSTLGNVSQTLGGSITDVSDHDTEEDITGKVADSVNHGNVLADLNAGGIAGAMAMENDLDHEEDWDFVGDNSLNFESELRAVIANCTNHGEVTCKKQNGGGIVGWQSMGLVKGSINAGKMNGADADYIGGITGQSSGFIRNCSSKCEILGHMYVGGIAGSATIVSDCRSLVLLQEATEKFGEVLGDMEKPYQEVEDPISNNFYLSVGKDLGGIDGISYNGKTDSLPQAHFLALEKLPELFQTVQVRFKYPNGNIRTFTVPLGDAFDMQWVPPIPPMSGSVGGWKDLEEEAMKAVHFDVTFEPEYRSKTTVLQSEQIREDKPVLLVQGVFEDGAYLTLSKNEDEIPLEKEEELLENWSFTVAGGQSLTEARLHIPEDVDADHVTGYLCGEDGAWRQVPGKINGSYLVFALQQGDQGIALVCEKSVEPYLLGIAGAIVLLMSILLVKQIKKKK